MGLGFIETFEDMECAGTCASGEEALEHIPQINPDVVLMDIRLPQMSGRHLNAPGD